MKMIHYNGVDWNLDAVYKIEPWTTTTLDLGKILYFPDNVLLKVSYNDFKERFEAYFYPYVSP